MRFRPKLNACQQVICSVYNTEILVIVAFGRTNGDFYVALGSSMGLAVLVWVGGGLLKRVLWFFGNEPSLGKKSPILHLPP